MFNKLKKQMYVFLGVLFFALGVIGAFLPLLPTTPFMILAAFCFSRGSEKMHQWLLTRPHIGPALREWEQYRVIRPRAKKLASVMMVIGIGVSIHFTQYRLWHAIILISIATVTLSYIWTRNSYPGKK